MKTKLGLVGMVIGIAMLVTACNDTNITNSETANIIKNGTWRITYYYDTDHEETSSFSGFNFTFNENGTVTAIKGISSVSGTWSTGTDDSQVKLILNFGANTPFDELNDDWHVIELKDVKVRLEDVSGGGGGTDELTFEKN